VKLGVAQNLHVAICPKDPSARIFSRCDIANHNALQNHTSTLNPAQAVHDFDPDFQRLQSEIMECRSIILKKCEGNASARFGLSELITSAYRPDKIF